MKPRLSNPPIYPASPAIGLQHLSASGTKAWDCYVERHPDGSVCHASGWLSAVQCSFGHHDHSLIARRGDDVCGVLPLMQVNSRIAGRLLVSVPYATYGGVLADDPLVAETLLAAARTLAVDCGSRSLDLRSAHAADPALPIIDRYATYRREMPATPDDIIEWIPRKARAAARRAAENTDLTTEFGIEHLPAVWQLYSRSMRRLGSPNYPLRFFEALAQNLPGTTDVLLIRAAGTPVAGLISFHFAEVAMPYFVGADERSTIYGINNLLYRTAMQRAVTLGCRIYDFGRSRRENTGPSDFKRLHGFEPTTLQYQLFTPPGRTPPDLSPGSRKWSAAREIWRRLPLPLTQWLGARVAGSIPG